MEKELRCRGRESEDLEIRKRMVQDLVERLQGVRKQEGRIQGVGYSECWRDGGIALVLATSACVGSLTLAFDILWVSLLLGRRLCRNAHHAR